jgi:hypothetical protein
VKLAGKVLDAPAFSKVRTYCVDTSNLKGPFNATVPGDVPQPETFDVLELMKTESGPKGLLSKLPWKLEADCSAPGVDAVVRIDFLHIEGGDILRIPPYSPSSGVPNEPLLGQYNWRALLQVSDRASSRVVYKAEGNPLNYNLGRTADTVAQFEHVVRREAAYQAFWALISDIKAMAKNP